MKFPQKLWNIVNDNSSSAIKWSPNGKSIIVDYETLQMEYLSSTNSTFKTRNVDSFVRQLNLYGFKKITSFLRDDAGNLQRSQVHEYLHSYFQENRKELLQNVRRKSTSKTKESKEKNYVHEFNENKKLIDKKENKSNLQECQNALTKELEQAVCDYKREKHLKEMENVSFQYSLTPEAIVMDVSNVKDKESEFIESNILMNAENIVYRISNDNPPLLIPIQNNVDLQLCLSNIL